MFPWKLYADPSGYIFTWLIGYSALLGPIGGIMIADYFVFRKRVLAVDDLYRPRRPLSLHRRFQPGRARRAPPQRASESSRVPGHDQALPAAAVGPVFISLYHYAWFVGFALAFAFYLLGRRFAPNE